jgi:hypothetical protein
MAIPNPAHCTALLALDLLTDDELADLSDAIEAGRDARLLPFYDRIGYLFQNYTDRTVRMHDVTREALGIAVGERAARIIGGASADPADTGTVAG